MLTAKNLERMIELEERLKAEYEVKLDAKAAEIDGLNKKLAAQQLANDTKLDAQQVIIAKQLEQISTLATEATANRRIEQLNRELTSRGEKLETEVATLKSRLKALQKDLADERVELKALRQLDAPAMKKNLHANKKKLAEKTTAADLLQKSVNKYKNENAELQGKIKELELQVAEASSTDEPEAAEAAAA